jgi:hypothetical protein
VWSDANSNGAQDEGPGSGINGVTVRLYQGSCPQAGSPYRILVTAGDGGYDFTLIPPGTYCVDVDEATLPAGYTLTTGNEPKTVNLGPGQNYMEADFGYHPPTFPGQEGPFCVGGIVFEDITEDGIQNDPSLEPQLSGFTVQIILDRNDNKQLDAGDFPPLETITTTGTPYRSGELGPGAYFVNAEAPTAEPPWTRTLPQGPVMLTFAGPGSDICTQVNFGFKHTSGSPTAATLRLFTATASGNSVTVAWETITEIDNLGFNVWRSAQPDAGYQRVNSTLIPSRVIGSGGASYAFVDHGVPAGTWYYKLETISSTGQPNEWHGPVSIQIGKNRLWQIRLLIVTR